MSERTGYADIAAHYRRKIMDGELRPGEALPSMRDVQEAFGVSVTTANRAFRVLKQEGLTIPNSGVNTIVADRRQLSSTGKARAERLERTGKEFVAGETSSDHQAERISCWDPEFADLLDIELNDEVVVRRRVFRYDGRPTTFAVSIIHSRATATVPEVAQQGQLKPFWHVTYKERAGRDIIASPERRTARHASDDELTALEVDAPPTSAVPVLVIRTVWHDEDGPIEVWEDVHAPGTWQVDSE